MNAPETVDFLPKDLLQITLQRSEDGEKEDVTALACRYVPIDVSSGDRGIAIEVMLPPAGVVIGEGPVPIRLKGITRLLLAPKLVHHIAPLRP